jgi:hypothetical protein
MFDANVHKTIEVGTKVAYRPGWGEGPSKIATITHIDLCSQEGEKYGEEVQSVAVEDVRRCCFKFDDDHWAYGYQVDKIV